jgi:hypothetical protein
VEVVDERFTVVEDTLLVDDVDAVTIADVDLVVLLVEEGNVVEAVAVAVEIELDEPSEEVVKAENEEDENVEVDPKGVVLTE